MKWTMASVVGLLAAAVIAAQPPSTAPSTDAQSLLVQAAVSNAKANLRQQLLHIPLARGITISDLLDSINGTDALSRVLDQARQIGGPRWIDPHTCQVRLEISGPILAAALIHQADKYPQHSRLSPQALRQALSDWGKLNFSAIGSSVTGESIELARPHYDIGAWSDVPSAHRRKAVRAAKHDAQRKVLDAIATLPLQNDLLVRDALAQSAISDPIDQWVDHQPVTKVEFLTDLRVSVTIAISPQALASTLRDAIVADKAFSAKLSIDWKQLREALEARVGPTVGSASAALMTATTTPALVLPIEPLGGVDQPLQAEATAAGPGTRLKVARHAEAAADRKLRDQFLRLKISPDETLADAAKTDPRIHQAIDRAMLQARTDHVEYRADGSALVHVSLDLRLAWEQLRSNQGE